VKWRCVTADGVEFDVNPKGTLDQKREWLRDGEQYIGKLLTVRYMGFTEKGIPKIAVGVAFRLDEDLPLQESNQLPLGTDTQCECEPEVLTAEDIAERQAAIEELDREAEQKATQAHTEWTGKDLWLDC
jgi:hypothetical protein